MTHYPNRHRRHLPCRPRFSSSALLSPLLLLPPLLPRLPLHQHPPPPLLPPPLPPPPPPPPHPAHGRRHLRPRLLVLSPGPPRLGGGGGGGLPVCRHAVEAVPRQEGVEAYQLQKASARIPAQLKSVKLVNNYLKSVRDHRQFWRWPRRGGPWRGRPGWRRRRSLRRGRWGRDESPKKIA